MSVIHPTADVQTKSIGDGTRIWQYVIVLAGAVIGRDCNVNAHCLIEGGAALGDRVTLKCGVYVWDGVTLGDDVFVGPNATFTNDRHPRSKRPRFETAHTMVEHGASIGAGAVLIAPITVGPFALIGAGAVVRGSVPAHALVVGNPGRQIGWVCECARTLPDDLRCRGCGLAFHRADDGELRRV